MEMYDVLNKLKAIENPSEDEQRAIQSAEAMNNPTNPAAKPAENTLMPETQEVSATGEEVYQPVAQETPTEYARLAGLQTLNVQTDAPETTTESVEIEEAKPDFLDLDKDGDKEESMKKAAKDKEEEVKEEDTTPEQYEKNERVTEEGRRDHANQPIYLVWEPEEGVPAFLQPGGRTSRRPSDVRRIQETAPIGIRGYRCRRFLWRAYGHRSN